MGNRVTPASFFKHTPKAKRYQEGHELTESNKRCLEKDRKFLEATERKREERRAKIKSGEIKLKKGGPISREAIAGINYDPTKDLLVQPADTIPPDMQEARDKYDKWKAEYDQLISQMKASRPSKEERIAQAIANNEYERLKSAAKFMKRDERLMMEAFIEAKETMERVMGASSNSTPELPVVPKVEEEPGPTEPSSTSITRAEANIIFAKILAQTMHNQQLFDAAFRELCLSSLFFLLVYGLNRKDADRDWIYERCNEVQANPNNHLDLVFRAGYKSTIITFAKTIQDIFSNPNLTIGIFSHTRPIAKTFLRQIKREFETNDTLKRVFSDILYENPNSQAAKWNEDEGIVVKRQSNPKEPIDCEEPVLTANGWKKHGELIVGDRVFGPDGNQTTVISVTEKWSDLPCYKVVFGNHSVVAAETHLWEASVRRKTREMKRNGIAAEENYRIYTTKELKEQLEISKTGRLAVRVTAPLQMSKRNLPIDPYVLGCWLGDGSKSSARFISSREDFPHFSQEMIKAGHSVYIYKERKNAILYQLDRRDKTKNCLRGHDMEAVGIDKTGRCRECNRMRQRIGNTPPTLTTFPWKLRSLGVFKNKHIPEEYLLASENQRLSLLQGLMDTDGCASKKDGQAIFANTNAQLSEGVYFLAASLGMKPSIKKRERLYKGNPHIMWWVTFVAHINYPPFRMARKIVNCSKAINHIRKTRHVVNAVEKVESRPVSCICVDNDTGCYLVGKSLITTHNSSLESWGLVDGQPTSRHFDIMVYDDVVTLESVSTPEMIQKTTNAWEISLNLRSEHGVARYIGTRYHRSDTYQTIIDRGAAIPRIYPVYQTDSDGNQISPPILLTQEQADQKRKEMGPFNFAAQLLLNPVALDVQGFKESWLRYWKPNPANLNIYITCDPAGEKKKTSDYTVFMVIGLGPDQNYYLIDMIRDRLSLTERGDTLFHLHKLYRPKAVGYEKYGKDSDIEHYEDRMKQENYRFPIIPLKGAVSKNDRIRKLIPLFEQSRVFIPEYLIKTDYEGKQQNLTQAFVRDEYLAFPIGQHDDMIDCLARILDKDLNARFPYAAADGSSIMSRGNFRVIRGRRAC